MTSLAMDKRIIDEIKAKLPSYLHELLGNDLIQVILYGSCARGDYTEDSDIDIAILTKCDRIDAQKYNAGLVEISTELAMQYFAVINFVCLPYEEYMENKSWYFYFKNIEKDGQIIYE